ncbi:MAG: CRISPR-associated endonuclease Cas2 [Mariprofundaceae bacterium]|nr:CRISPR-associated endonuclease Cas2 [Mariprofundaceae bacterium]
MNTHYLVCFDITDDRIRNRVGKVLLRHGQRVQESVFEIALKNPRGMEKLREKLAGLLEEENELRFYRLCLDCRKASKRIDGMPLAAFPAVVII